jgi:hypothetical protein
MTVAKRWLVTAVLLLPGAPLASQDVLQPQVQTIESVADYEEMLSVGCSLGCAIGWSYQASSTLPASGGIRYGALNLGDASLSTAWVEGAPGYGVGEAVTIIFGALPEAGEGVGFRGIELVNGYAKNAKTWRENSRVKRLSIGHNGGFLFELSLADTIAPQAFSFKDVDVRPGDRLTLTILDVYPGGKFDDTAISEIHFYGAH